ncbi:MAG: maleylacetoacetate isomerase [Hyphomonadaceae bacterium]|nr:maleylacetoacetate isomerase [Hyphomonadaceae bacterium]MBC6411496.1 maleylacetoacetate isomerase [Hyphomonadaceae bacterium]
MSDLILHNYFRSSASVRVRAALNLKGLDYSYTPYALLLNEHKSEGYLGLNPQGLVPALEIGKKAVLTQSMAIIEYLDEAYPKPPLMPSTALERARVRSLAQITGCDIHPVNNLRILRFISDEYGVREDGKAAWFRHWAATGFMALETRLALEPETGEFCHGAAPGLADIHLYAQVLNNARFNVDPAPYPTIMRIFEACDALSAFQDARPENQPDAY